jgi:hypothetical protein
MHPVNLALRFLLELAALAALAVWGLRTGPGPMAAVALAVLPPPARLGIELGLFALAVLALRQAGASALGGMLAAAVALHQGWRVLEWRRRG